MNCIQQQAITIPIPLLFKTEITTRLNHKDIIGEKMIGEGAFAIVYKGNFMY